MVESNLSDSPLLEQTFKSVSYTHLITVKLNSLTDRETIDMLKEASMAGVKVRMIIRGICCLLPGVDGYTDLSLIHI